MSAINIWLLGQALSPRKKNAIVRPTERSGTDSSECARRKYRQAIYESGVERGKNQKDHETF